MSKQEFAPLFPAGFHKIEIIQFEKLFITNFSNNTRRKLLVSQLLIFLHQLNTVKAVFEIWLDGSFTTEKEEPEDIDILIIYNELEINNLPSQDKSLLLSLFDREISKIRYNIDVLICPDHDQNNRSYWRGWFGFTRSEQPKGIPRFSHGTN